ncbi:MAG: hypothetical protein AAF518_07595, partial [Spirochaetota bacterium]
RMLVRTLQDPERRFTKLGDTVEQKTNFELVSASHLSIDALQKKLDIDFFDRISIFTCKLPSLHEMKKDIRTYWNSIWHELRNNTSNSEKAIWNKKIENFFLQHPLNGNFRDLQRFAYLLMSEELANPNATIEEQIKNCIDDLENNYTFTTKQDFDSLLSATEGDWKQRTTQLQSQLAKEAVKKYGNLTKAAEFLKCDKGTLSKILNK